MPISEFSSFYRRELNDLHYKMEGDEDDDDIWDEKSLKLPKRKQKNSTHKRRKCSTTKLSKRTKKDVNKIQVGTELHSSQAIKSDNSGGDSGSRSLRKTTPLKRKRTDSSTSRNEIECQETASGRNTCQHEKASSTVSNKKVTPQKDIMDGFCPKCQMPFSAVIGQSPGWHVRECLETKYSYIGIV